MQARKLPKSLRRTASCRNNNLKCKEPEYPALYIILIFLKLIKSYFIAK